MVLNYLGSIKSLSLYLIPANKAIIRSILSSETPISMTQQQSLSARDTYENFIDEVLDNEIIWGLSNEEGWASCDSNDFESRQVIPFWSSEKLAQKLCIDDWADNKPTPIRFNDFIDAWLHGMHDDEVMAGINWDEELVGPEIEPLMLIEDLIGDED